MAAVDEQRLAHIATLGTVCGTGSSYFLGSSLAETTRAARNQITHNLRSIPFDPLLNILLDTKDATALLGNAF
jgi:hypothetical protein